MKQFFFFALVLSVAACEGPVGPQGPPGPAGTSGLPGRQGNANVSEFTFTYTNNNVVLEDNIARLTVTIPELSEAIATDGAVLGFIRFGTTNRWVGLPLTEGVDTNNDGNVDFNWEYTYNYEAGTFELRIGATGRRVTGVNDGSVKVVLIGGAFGKTGVDLDFESYEEAAYVLGLEL
jgi:hypothetical protein